MRAQERRLQGPRPDLSRLTEDERRELEEMADVVREAAPTSLLVGMGALTIAQIQRIRELKHKAFTAPARPEAAEGE